MKAPYSLSKVHCTDFSHDGLGIVKHEGFVYFVKGLVPGDIANIEVFKKKKNLGFAKIQEIISPSNNRITPVCEHFGLCGGCKMQNIHYDAQLEFKQHQVQETLSRLGNIDTSGMHNISGSAEVFHYRNKMEYTFSNHRWVLDSEPEGVNRNGIGFHIPGRFDKVLHIKQCHLQHQLGNEVRNYIYDFALEHNLSFYNLRDHEGELRTLMLRNNRKGEWMVLLSFSGEQKAIHIHLLEKLQAQFPAITSLLYTYNLKKNDTIYDLDIFHFSGEETLTESLFNGKSTINYQINPKAFFQTNSTQTEYLYQQALALAELKKEDVVYDLYTGTGSIACFVAEFCDKVIGIESVPEAIVDAKKNAALNGINNTVFYAGDMKDIFNASFVAEHGKADVIITDPPRAGMHPDVVVQLLETDCPLIVYISCNPATQARDVELLSSKYEVTYIQPVDMFPHTQHVENIIQLKLKR
jgi:23S rRNA (uracil1939-C5)-methyltransferase